MVWEQGVFLCFIYLFNHSYHYVNFAGSVVLVLLTRLNENGQTLCQNYWPEEGSQLYHIYEVTGTVENNVFFALKLRPLYFCIGSFGKRTYLV